MEAMVGAASDVDGVPEICVDELESRREAGAAVFDVRETWEHRRARIPGAISIPLGSVPDSAERFQAAAATGPVCVVCAVGGRSAQAVRYLRDLGIDAVNVAGGTNAWLEAGKPVEAGTPIG